MIFSTDSVTLFNCSEEAHLKQVLDDRTFPVSPAPPTSGTVCHSTEHVTSSLSLEVFTSSSAVAKRPRSASCLSVVSFNSTKRRAESFIVCYVGYKIITACN